MAHRTSDKKLEIGLANLEKANEQLMLDIDALQQSESRAISEQSLMHTLFDDIPA